ncbi:MAG: NUDIX domain-containing protein [Candidatus Aenigmarchaeota archaeon]|nr:NUDIX domain-containing protein [Candidatus Aenigmarchaeota archaeon]
MEDETYDVVNEDDRVVGKATWTECHRKGLRHRTSCVLIFKDRTRREILLQKRSTDMEQDPGLWQHSAGGHVMAGETARKAAETEMKEELFAGMRMPDIKLRRVLKFANDNLAKNKEITTVFEAVHPGPFRHDRKEVGAKPVWTDLDFVLKDVRKNPGNYTVSFRNIIREYAKSRKA